MRKNLLLKSALWLIILPWVSTTSLLAQSKLDRQKIVNQTNVTYLKAQSKELRQTAEKEKKLAVAKAKQNNWIISKELENGGYMELQKLDANGKPIYYITNNVNAAATVSTNEVWAGGSAGLDLDGTGMIVGEWDGGNVRTTHQEFNNTGTSRIVDKDGGTSTSAHSTHVAGTMVAGGVDANAKGMAYNATLHAYDWTSDASEMAAAASDGLLLSNHSYGRKAGWCLGWFGLYWTWYGDPSISTEEDYQFGFYGSECAEWDDIASNAPYYLIVKSAGNDRGDGAGQSAHPQDGGADGYDCIGYVGNAKNILTVGAVKDVPGGYTNPADVEMTSFSGWGPADDGRIKPDICGNGFELYSTDDGYNTDYRSLSGTSMASPNVTGSLLLLQEYYQETTGDYMRAATLKALAIHTADECGPNDGPDYMFGWGLLNTRKAADVITNRETSAIISEEVLADGESFTLEVNASGTEPLVATIVWTDPAGTPVPAQLDPTDIMLVNDLDMTISDGSSTYYPYMLDGQNPANAATTGDNDVDNVEKIFIDNPSAGTYTITINHEGNITGDQQAFSLIVTGVENNVAVTGVSLDMATATIVRGDTQQLTATVEPSDATNQDVTWSSSDDNIATVSATGLVTAVAAGNATITVTTADGGFTADCVVTVIVPATGVSLDMNTATIARGNTQQLTATVEPSDATNQDVTWSSSDDNIATVSPTGLVTAVAAGNATITVTTADGGFTANCAVTVTVPVYAIDIDNHDFGVIDLVATATQDFTISNTGDADLVINSMTVNGANAAEFTHNAAMPLTIAPGNSHTFTVTFDPAGLGWRHAQIDLVTNDGNHAVTLKGAATSSVPTIPVSNWAIILGVAIIIGGSLLRFVIKN